MFDERLYGGDLAIDVSLLKGKVQADKHALKAVLVFWSNSHVVPKQSQSINFLFQFSQTLHSDLQTSCVKSRSFSVGRRQVKVFFRLALLVDLQFLHYYSFLLRVIYLLGKYSSPLIVSNNQATFLNRNDCSKHAAQLYTSLCMFISSCSEVGLKV